MSTPIITPRMLRGACKEQKAIFKAEWPDGAPAPHSKNGRLVRRVAGVSTAGGEA